MRSSFFPLRAFCILKAALLIICLIMTFFICPVKARAVSAAEPEARLDDELQVLYSSLPEETRQRLREMGITSSDMTDIISLGTVSILSQAASMLAAGSGTPLCGTGICLGIMLLCAMSGGFHAGLCDRRLQTIQNGIGAMSVCTAVIVPLCVTVSKAAEIIKGASGFMLLYVPVLTGLLVTSGKEVTAASYYSTMMTVGNVVSLAASGLVLPLMNVFLALSVTASLSPGLRLGNLCSSVYKIAKWIITFVMSVFVTVSSLKTIITSSMDNVSRRALRFAVGSFVPVVGNVLGEALTAFNGSLELLRSGAGVFVIIASAFIILPVLLECIVWQFSTFLLSSVSEILGLSQMTGLFSSVSKACGMLTALVLCVLVVFIISTVMLLLAGRGG